MEFPLSLFVHWCGVIFLIGDFAEPGNAAAADIELCSARMGRRTVPMHNSGRAVVRFTGTQLYHWSALLLVQTDSVFHQDDLAPRMAVPFSTGAGPEIKVRGLSFRIFLDHLYLTTGKVGVGPSCEYAITHAEIRITNFSFCFISQPLW